MPEIPEGTLVHVVGDIHGRSDCLEDVFEKIDRDPMRRDHDRCLEIYLGDYVDRGPKSRDVISLLIDRMRERSVVALRGNHERLMQDALLNADSIAEWRMLGGLETISSYGVAIALPLSPEGVRKIHAQWSEVIPDDHHAFLAGLVNSVQEGDYFFAHAGVRPGVALHRQIEEDLLWIRDEFLDSIRWHGKVIVHGHTPVEEPEVLPNRINIDTGAYLTGRLTCLRLCARERTVITGVTGATTETSLA